MREQRWPVSAALVSLVLLAPGASFDAAPKRAPFALAVLRRDGMLVPFATYDGRWRNPWPEAGPKAAEVPIGLDAIPRGWWLDKKPITDWILFPLAGSPQDGRDGGDRERPRTVHVTGVNAFRSGCEPGIGLRTDYRPTILPPDPRVHPYPKDALAFSGDAQLAPIDIVDPKDRVPLSLADQLPSEIIPKEDQIIDAYSHRDDWKHSYSKREREKVPVALEALYRVRGGLEGRDLYYFEAVKRYVLPKDLKPEQASCDLVTFASGWFSTETPDGRIRDLDPHVAVTSCDFRGVRFMRPMATTAIDNTRVWIVQWSTTSDESYMIIEPKKSDVMDPVLIASGGGCPLPGER